LRPTSRFVTALAVLVVSSIARFTHAEPGTVWLDFTAAPLVHASPMTVATAAGTLVDVTVQTGGTQGLYSFNRDTLGVIHTGLDYDSLYCLAIFNGGGTSSVSTTITFSNIRVGAGHERGYFLVGAVNGISSPVTITSSVAGRVSSWTQVGDTFPFSPEESFAIDWNAPSGTFLTSAVAGNDSRGVVIDLGDLRTDGTITVSLSQYLNDGIYFALGEKLLEPLSAQPDGPSGSLSLASPHPNPARDGARFDFALPAAGRVRLAVFDAAGRKLATVRDGHLAAGRHSASWDLRGSDGARLGAGLVFVRLETETGARTRRMIVLR